MTACFENAKVRFFFNMTSSKMLNIVTRQAERMSDKAFYNVLRPIFQPSVTKSSLPPCSSTMWRESTKR